MRSSEGGGGCEDEAAADVSLARWISVQITLSSVSIEKGTSASSWPASQLVVGGRSLSGGGGGGDE